MAADTIFQMPQLPAFWGTAEPLIPRGKPARNRRATSASSSLSADRWSLDLHAPAWLRSLTESVRRLSDLRDGWDGPGSIPLDREILFAATSAVRSALGPYDDAVAPHLVPGGDGSVQVEWHEKRAELELDFSSDGVHFWLRNHQTGSELEAYDEKALGLFYHWAAWVAAEPRDETDVQIPQKIFIEPIAA